MAPPRCTLLRSPALLLALILLHNPSPALSSSPIYVPFSPTCAVDSVRMLSSSLQWQVVAHYTFSELRTATTTTTPDEGDILTIPILYFPTPGNGKLTLGSNPCIGSPGPCCLLRFAELYTNVGLYRALQAGGDAYLALKAACSSDEDDQPPLGLDARPFVRELVRYAAGIGNSSASSYYVTSALTGLRGCTINASASLSSPDRVKLDARIQHPAMAQQLSSPLGSTNLTSSSGSVQQLQTFLGLMWVRTLPFLSAGTSGGLEFDASHTRITLDVTAAVAANAAALSAETGCRMTPQGVCLVCDNRIDDQSGFYVFTQAGAETRQCEFRCRQGWFYAPGAAPPSTAACVPCTEDRQCPAGQFVSECLLEADAGCSFCLNQTACPTTGGWTRELCVGGTDRTNGACVPCGNAPSGARYLPDPPGSPGECAWECGYAYKRVLEQCVFAPEITLEAKDDSQISVSVQTNLIGLYVGDTAAGGGLFNEDLYKAALSEQVPGISPDNVYIIDAVMVYPGGRDAGAIRRRRRLLQSSPTSAAYLQVDSYFWVTPSIIASDVSQDIIEAVRDGKFQASLSILTGVPVAIDPSSNLASYESQVSNVCPPPFRARSLGDVRSRREGDSTLL